MSINYWRSHARTELPNFDLLFTYKTWKFSKIYGEIKLKQIQIECFSFYSFDNLQKTLWQTEN